MFFTNLLRHFTIGPTYINKRRFINKTQYLDNSSLLYLQKNELLKLFNLAKSIPFYKKLFRNLSLSNKVDPIDILQNLPILDKNSISNNLDQFHLPLSYRSRLVTTSGSSGNPFSFYIDIFTTRQIEKAYIFDMWRRIGYKLGNSILNLRGRTPRRDKFIEYDRIFNTYYASSINLTIDSISKYIEYINRYKPLFLHGYPSTIYQLALLAEHANVNLDHQFKGIFCGSEKLYTHQRIKIESFFSSRVYHWYGHSENLALGGECEQSYSIHFYPQYGYTEFMPSGIFNEHKEELYEIVATGFNNKIMPMIRYRTGDFAILMDKKNCSCGRNYLLVKEIVGRQQEFIVDKRENLISITSLISGQHFNIFRGLHAIKILQKIPGQIDLIMEKNKYFVDNDLKELKTKLNNLIGDSIVINYYFSKNLHQKESHPKFKLVEQHLSIDDYLYN